MNITQENVTNLTAEIKVNITKEDYTERVETILKDYRKKASIPGFRPGKVPMGMITKMYGDAIFIDELNKLLQDKLNEYIKNNELKIFGYPIPNHEKTTLVFTRRFF